MADKNKIHRDQIYSLLVEFKPFNKKQLEHYLKNIQMKRKVLDDRRSQVRADIEKLMQGVDIDGMTLEERIKAYAYSSRTMDNLGGSSGGHYDPDTLYKQYLKIYYEPIEQQLNVYMSTMRRLSYERMQLEKVQQCVDELPYAEMDIILCVYINNMPLVEYYEYRQMGHSKYYQLKEVALKNLLASCNTRLKELHEVWEKSNEKMSLDGNDHLLMYGNP